jgi:glyoxylate utilization-related uncharacterized protein
MLLGIMSVRVQSVAVAQDATPAADDMMEESVSLVPLGFAAGVELPSSADLIAVRVTVEPGVSSPFAEEDPTGGMLVVESGAFTIQIETAWTVTRGDALEEAMDAPEGEGDMAGVIEAVSAGQEMTIAAGDVAYIPGSVAGELRNDGQEPAVGLIFLIAPGGTLPQDAAPAATPPA